jgi:hypothetical protein
MTAIPKYFFEDFIVRKGSFSLYRLVSGWGVRDTGRKHLSGYGARHGLWRGEPKGHDSAAVQQGLDFIEETNDTSL